MTAADIIQGLTDACARADVDPADVEVRVAHQPSWAFEYSLDEGPDLDVVQVTDTRYDGSPGDEINAIYFAEGSQIGYLPSAAREMIGW